MHECVYRHFEWNVVVLYLFVVYRLCRKKGSYMIFRRSFIFGNTNLVKQCIWITKTFERKVALFINIVN